MLSIEQHHRPEGPGKQLTECGKDTGKRCVIESQGLILRVYDPQKDEADGKHTGGIPEHKERTLKPAALVHGRAEIQQGDDHDENTKQQQHQQRHRILYDDAQVDGGDPEEHQIVCTGAGNAVGKVGVDVLLHTSLFKDRKHDQRHQEGVQVRWAVKVEGVIEKLIEQAAGAGGSEQDGKVPGQRIQDHRRGCCLGQRGAVLRRDQASLQLAGEIGKVLDVLGPALFGAQLDKKHSTEYTSEDPHSGTGLTDVQGVRKAKIRKAAAHGGCGAVSTGEAGRQQQAKAIIDLRPQIGDHQN